MTPEERRQDRWEGTKEVLFVGGCIVLVVVFSWVLA